MSVWSSWWREGQSGRSRIGSGRLLGCGYTGGGFQLDTSPGVEREGRASVRAVSPYHVIAVLWQQWAEGRRQPWFVCNQYGLGARVQQQVAPK